MAHAPTKYINCRIEDEKGWRQADVSLRSNTLVGQSGSEYQIGNKINSGQNGVVFECWPKGVRSKACHAVKFLRALSDQRKERFEFECAVLEQLNHNNILRYIDSGEHETTQHGISVPFLVTDRLDGNLYEEVMRNGPMGGEALVDAMKQICDGFSHVHRNGIIHRDIKPGNFFKKGTRIVIGDFGLAKTASDEGQARFYKGDMTKEGENVGPQSFMSPELLRYAVDKSTPVDHRSDIFQIGAVAWFLLTGVPPAGLIDAEDDPTGGKIFPVIERCIRSRPANRHQSAEALKIHLGDVCLT